MARPLPVNMLFAGTGAVLLISGIGGEPIEKVLQGSFGNLKTNPKVGTSSKSTSDLGEGGTENVSDTEGEGGGGEAAPSPTVFSSATVAPSPTSFSSKEPTKKQQAAAIARILLSEGITRPTSAQINAARERYERETGIPQTAVEAGFEFEV